MENKNPTHLQLLNSYHIINYSVAILFHILQNASNMSDIGLKDVCIEDARKKLKQISECLNVQEEMYRNMTSNKKDQE